MTIIYQGSFSYLKGSDFMLNRIANKGMIAKNKTDCALSMIFVYASVDILAINPFDRCIGIL